ncbi:MAG: amidohydrolase [Betaproteobacteria bacterium]|nr:amidohydrolase [Betaproteobacteria bacterium]
MIVDFHVHLFAAGHLPRRWFDALARYLASKRPATSSREELAAKLEGRILDPDATYLFADLDAAKIDVVVSHPLDYGVALGEPRSSPEEIVAHNAALQKRYAGRYISFTGIDPRRPGAAEFVRSTIRRFDLNGLNLYPMAGFDPASPESLAVCRVAMEENVPVMFHSGGAVFPMRARYGNPALLGDVQAELPDLKFIIGHAGFPYHWTDAVDVARRNPNAYLELSQWYKLASRNYGKFVEILAEIKHEMGTERILWGSDHLSGPAVGGDKSALTAWLDCIRRLPQASAEFSQEDVDMILGANAKRLLDLDETGHA